jgi:NADPH:quinone reductase-like Zn-dependent oxidoreductase
MSETKKIKLDTDAQGNTTRYSIADQQLRFANAKKQNNTRYLDITTVYDGSFLKGKRVAITGANRGLGLELSKVLAKEGAKIVAIVRKSSDELDALQPEEIISGIDVTNDETTKAIKEKLKGGPVDIVRYNCVHMQGQNPVLVLLGHALIFGLSLLPLLFSIR